MRHQTRSAAALWLFLSVFAFGCGDPGRLETADPTDTLAGDASMPDAGVDADPATDASTNADDCGCFAGEGTFCGGTAVELAADAGCALNVESSGTDDLLRCAADVWTVEESCTASCEVGEELSAAECGLPYCDCFVQVAWCGASAARHGLTLDPPCRVPLAAENDQDVLECDGNTWVVQETCDEGCYEAPTGTPDACVSGRAPGDPDWEPCPQRPLIRNGVHPEASDRLRCAGVSASQITQTIGSAAASAGYHAADGTAAGASYTAAIDLSVRGMNEAGIKDLLRALGRNGFAVWYRKPGSDGWPSSEAPHIHAVFAGVVMKSQLRGQVRDFLVGRNGLASHTLYRFWTPSDAILEIVRVLFERNYTP